DHWRDALDAPCPRRCPAKGHANHCTSGGCLHERGYAETARVVPAPVTTADATVYRLSDLGELAHLRVCKAVRVRPEDLAASLAGAHARACRSSPSRRCFATRTRSSPRPPTAISSRTSSSTRSTGCASTACPTPSRSARAPWLAPVGPSWDPLAGNDEGAGSEREKPSCFRPLQSARDAGFEPCGLWLRRRGKPPSEGSSASQPLAILR